MNGYGESTHTGIGLVENNCLCSSWTAVVRGRMASGVVVYKLEQGRLVGRGTQYPGDGSTLRETLTRVE